MVKKVGRKKKKARTKMKIKKRIKKEKKGITPIISVVLLLMFTVVIAMTMYSWYTVVLSKPTEQLVETRVAQVTTSMVAGVQAISLNSTKNGVIIRNRGTNPITTVSVEVNGAWRILNYDITIAPGEMAVVPLNYSAEGEESTTVKVLAVDSEGGAATVTETFVETGIWYNVTITNATCSPCPCNVTIDGTKYCYNGSCSPITCP